MSKPSRVLIIHGWSDCSASFQDMKNYLIRQNVGQVETIYYADYESREDNITYEDVIEGLNNELILKKLIYNNGKSDYDLKIVVHSTGGLVVRHWLWRYYGKTGRIGDCPVTNLVMLAPANFGSPLAQMGKSFLGGLVKGRWKVGDMLETGKIMLDGLELGSSYQWTLAHNDLLGENKYFMPDHIRTVVMVGDTDYKGIRGWLNKPGTDGTVVIAGTNLNSAKLCLQFTQPDNLSDSTPGHQWVTTKPVSDIAFGVLRGLDHGSIITQSSADSENASAISNLLVRALQMEDESGFRTLQSDLTKFTDDAYAKSISPKFQQFLVHAVDYQDRSAMDFTLDFSVYLKSRAYGIVVNELPQTDNEEANDQTTAEYEYSRRINEIVNGEAHTFSRDSSYRRLLVNTTDLENLTAEISEDPDMAAGFGIFMKVYVPAVDKEIGYYTKNLQNILIYDSANTSTETPSFFFPNTTTLMEIQVDRVNGYVTVGTVPQTH
ncbi:hypothetical protein SAMN05216464_113121 [Mucilaginibacter pineti]|uniref:Uncharacterized protein n=1 Tax=Mucilaginibacter pineti TaxID=1391627 RepID=A0A1G7IRE6_9SPHI|nr:hypothetical protein [Mucilaginibacter pineti]SDF14879.1 hypothetical protein SAMN05216464_113121 [Mucilaginibacter pineti]